MNKNIFLPLFVALLGVYILAPSLLRAADPAGRAGIEPKVADLISLLSEGRIDAMLERIGPIPEHERASFEATRERLINVYSNAGKYSGFDIAGYKALTSRYQVVYVLVYFEKRPVLFEFGFYRIDDKWRPQHLTLETDFKAVLDTMPLQK